MSVGWQKNDWDIAWYKAIQAISLKKILGIKDSEKIIKKRLNFCWQWSHSLVYYHLSADGSLAQLVRATGS